MSAVLDTSISHGRVLISFPQEALPLQEREDFIAFLKAEWMARQSRLTEPDVSALADEVNSTWWSRSRERILGRIGAE